MKMRVFGVALVVAGISAAAIASAGTCKNVDIIAHNKGKHVIKVKYALYKCEGENEKKEQFSNILVQPDQIKTVAANQNLAGCKDKKMQYLEFGYEVQCDSKWSSERTVRDSSFLNAHCSSDSGKKYTVQIPSTTCD